MWRIIPFFLLGIGLVATPVQGAGSSSAPDFGESAYQGFTINQTMTAIGHEFYRAFVEQWREKDSRSRYTVAVYEKPSARWGSLVWVEFKNKKLFQSFLSTQRASAYQQGLNASEMVFEKIQEAEIEGALFKDPDMGKDEI